jgi:hypothetical protein
LSGAAVQIIIDKSQDSSSLSDALRSTSFSMESHNELLEKVATLNLLNTQLHDEIQMLDKGRDVLKEQCESNMGSLNSAIQGLPVVIDILLQEIPPVCGYLFLLRKGILM